ncbi:MAG: aminopeptidase P family protein, partial [Clostridia bacterium]|nr:aminopeptidase P family protein [Clostridia bacterium]
MFIERADRLLEALAGLGAEGIVVHNRSNIRYLSGYSGEGLLVIAKGLRAIVTDFRYTEQAEQEAPGFSVSMTTATKLHEAVAAELVTGIQTLAFEDEVVTVKGMNALVEAMPGVAFVSAGKKIESLRETKDDGERAAIEKAAGFTSQAFERVLQKIKPGMTETE